MEKARVDMGINCISKTAFRKLLHVVCAIFGAFGIKVCKKCQYDPQNSMFKKSIWVSKDAEFHAEFKSVPEV